jgi:hypothetical protein
MPCAEVENCPLVSRVRVKPVIAMVAMGLMATAPAEMSARYDHVQEKCRGTLILDSGTVEIPL